jgi:hypothetical protein
MSRVSQKGRASAKKRRNDLHKPSRAFTLHADWKTDRLSMTGEDNPKSRRLDRRRTKEKPLSALSRASGI